MTSNEKIVLVKPKNKYTGVRLHFKISDETISLLNNRFVFAVEKTVQINSFVYILTSGLMISLY